MLRNSSTRAKNGGSTQHIAAILNPASLLGDRLISMIARPLVQGKVENYFGLEATISITCTETSGWAGWTFR
jgi:hypothetical protein